MTENDINEWTTKYAICNAGQLYWFADRVNNYNENDICGVLADDIIVNKDLKAENLRAWTPIGGASIPYTATFDGRGHTVSGLYFNDDTAKYVGLFGKTDYSNDIKNINISNSYFKGDENIGSLIGDAGSMISKCTVDSTVTVTGNGYYGGIVGNSSGGSLENSLSMAKVTQSDKFMGGLVGNNCLAIKNCYTTSSNIVGHNNTSYYGSITNSYYLAETDNGDGGKTAEQFTNGEVAYLLQSGVDEIPAEGHWDDDYENYTVDVPAYIPQIWGQNIGTDKYPTFSTAKVYEDEYKGAKVYRNEIDGFEIILLGADKKSATVVLDKVGTYTIVFVDYEGEKLANIDSVEFEVTAPQAVRITLSKDFTLGTGDKIMLWNNLNNLAPMCEAFEVK